MIDIIDKSECSGCGACAQRCPKKCIQLVSDNEGFKYPFVNISECVNCGLCTKACHELHPYSERMPLKVFATYTENEEIRNNSSSGGIFSVLAEKVLGLGGVVFGASFDKSWNVIIKYVETKEGLSNIRGSKYVQSSTERTYKEAESLLKQGRMVFYSGTPCQIAGLYHYLNKNYPNLLTADFSCHGVPSPLIWRKYLDEIEECPKGIAGKNLVLSSLKEKPVITGISFRDKSTGWKKYGFVIRGKSAEKADKNMVLSSDKSEDKLLLHETHDKNIYMRAFLSDMISRPSCYACKATHGRSKSDFTLADYWRINQILPDMDDDKGTSLLLVNTEKALEFMTGLDIIIKETSYADAYSRNKGLRHCIKPHPNRRRFFNQYYKNLGGIFYLINKNLKITFLQKIALKLKSIIQ